MMQEKRAQTPKQKNRYRIETKSPTRETLNLEEKKSRETNSILKAKQETLNLAKTQSFNFN